MLVLVPLLLLLPVLLPLLLSMHRRLITDAGSGRYSVRGLCHERVGDLSAAMRDYNTATELNPKQRDAWTNKGNIHKDNEEWAEAIPAYSRRIELATPNDAHVHR